MRESNPEPLALEPNVLTTEPAMPVAMIDQFTGVIFLNNCFLGVNQITPWSVNMYSHNYNVPISIDRYQNPFFGGETFYIFLLFPKQGKTREDGF